MNVAHSEVSSGCGNLLNTVMKYDPVKEKASIENFYFMDEEFCDLGTNEINANFDLFLFDKNKKVLNKKAVSLNTMTVIELLKPNSNSFGKNKVVLAPQFRNVKFSIVGKKVNIVSYKIFFKANQKLIGEGAVQ